MGYRIDYQPIRKVRGAEKRIARSAVWIGISALLLFLLIESIWPDGVHLLQRSFVFGDPAVTVSVLENMKQTIQNGDTFSSALEVFCRTILAGT